MGRASGASVAVSWEPTLRPQGTRVCGLCNTAHLCGGAPTRALQGRILDRVQYERYRPKRNRPFGMGPFFDYGLAVAKNSLAKCALARERAPAQQSAEERWEGEGGSPEAPRKPTRPTDRT